MEEMSIKAFSSLVLKLSENSFRPLYLELFTWATQSEDVSPRVLTFYKLSITLARSLKSLFLLFFGHVLKNATEILKTINIREDHPGDIPISAEYSQELLVVVLDCLSTSLQYDNQGFVNKDRFNSLMQPLVDQLENTMFDESSYPNFISDHVMPALINFSAAVGDSANWKPLNDQVLLKTRSSEAKVRLATLKVLGAMYQKLGESFITVLPETIPFLAELLEDDSSEVERQCQDVISIIEEISGESLQKYF